MVIWSISVDQVNLRFQSGLFAYRWIETLSLLSVPACFREPSALQLI